MPSFLERAKRGWNAFKNPRDPTSYRDLGYSSAMYPGRIDRYPYIFNQNDFQVVVNKFAVDAATAIMRHAVLDEEGQFDHEVDSGLNNCLTVEANKDQTGRQFRQDIIQSMLLKGYIAVVPIDTDDDIFSHGSHEIFTMRVGQIVEWYPDYVKVDVYNDRTGLHEQRLWPKSECAILENPFYDIMNSPTSAFQRLHRKEKLLDTLDAERGSNKLNLIIQLPYTIRNELRETQAKKRIESLEQQMSSSPLGIAYTDSTEHIVQLNRPLENDLYDQIKDLREEAYAKIGITSDILAGTADETTMNNYNRRIIEPLLGVVADEFNRKYLSANARARRQCIWYATDPFRFIPVGQMADLADKFGRNEILTPNEIRAKIGIKPAQDPKANELRNRNISQSNAELEQDPVQVGGAVEHHDTED